MLASSGISHAQNLSGSDSLIGTIENTTDWKTPDSGVEGGSEFTNTDQGLQYTDTTTTDDNIDRKWKLNTGSYTEDWSVQLNVTLSGFTLSNDSQVVAIGLQVSETGNGGSNYMELNLGQSDQTGKDYLTYNTYINTNGVNETSFTSPDVAATLSGTSGVIQINYDAATQTISTDYDSTGVAGDWTLLGSTSISSGENNWDMTSTNTFTVAVQGYSDDTIINSADSVYATNFIAVPEPSSWAMLTAGAGLLFLHLPRRFRARPIRWASNPPPPAFRPSQFRMSWLEKVAIVVGLKIALEHQKVAKNSDSKAFAL